MTFQLTTVLLICARSRGLLKRAANKDKSCCYEGMMRWISSSLHLVQHARILSTLHSSHYILLHAVTSCYILSCYILSCYIVYDSTAHTTNDHSGVSKHTDGNILGRLLARMIYSIMDLKGRAVPSISLVRCRVMLDQSACHLLVRRPIFVQTGRQQSCRITWLLKADKLRHTPATDGPAHFYGSN